jgi:hypothetical protein
MLGILRSKWPSRYPVIQHDDILSNIEVIA